MVIKALKIEQTGDRQVNNLQQNVAAATATLRQGPFGSGNLVKGIFLQGNNPTRVSHGLGRTYLGFIVVRLRSGFTAATMAVIEQTTSAGAPTNTDTDKFAVLFAGQDCVADIWFF